MQLDGTFSVTCSNVDGTLTALTTSNVRYGESQNIITVDVTPDLLPDTNTYCVTIQGVHSQDGLLVDPNPAVCCFVHGREYPAFRILDRKWDHYCTCYPYDCVVSPCPGNPLDFITSYLNQPPDHIYTDTIPAPGWGVFTDFESPWQDLDDNYVDEALGFWVVPQTGNYYFWSASDDGSKTFLVTDALPSHKVLICNEPNWASYRAWADNSPEGGGRGIPPVT